MTPSSSIRRFADFIGPIRGHTSIRSMSIDGVRTTDANRLHLHRYKAGKITRITPEEHMALVQQARAKNPTAIAALQEKDKQLVIIEECIFGPPEKRARLLAEHFSERHREDKKSQVVCLAEIMHADFEAKAPAGPIERRTSHILMLASVDWQRTINLLGLGETQLWSEIALLSNNLTEMLGRVIMLGYRDEAGLMPDHFCPRMAEIIRVYYPHDVAGAGRLAAGIVRYAIDRHTYHVGFLLFILKELFGDNYDNVAEAFVNAMRMYPGSIELKGDILVIENQGLDFGIPLFEFALEYCSHDSTTVLTLLEKLRQRCRTFNLSVQ